MLLRQRHRPLQPCSDLSSDNTITPPEITRLKLLSFNIQSGIPSQSYHHYLTRSWQHILPHRTKQQSLDHIGRLLRDFDFVALQEVDGGSFRSGYINQVRYLAETARLPYWYQQLNRNLGHLAQHSNGVLSRYHPQLVEDHCLPGFIPGRGAILLQFGQGNSALLILTLHLSLGQRAQRQQLDYVRELIGDHRHVVLMGDLNCHHKPVIEHPALRDLGLHRADNNQPTFPSWRPARALDHILISSTLNARQSKVLDFAHSDHLPVALEVELPTPQRWH